MSQNNIPIRSRDIIQSSLLVITNYLNIKFMTTKVQKENYFDKRRILKDSGECLFDLKDSSKMLFEAFYKAVSLYEEEIVLTPPNARCRGHEAVLLNSKIIQCVMEMFPDNSKFGRYKRFIVRLKGYIFFFKKLDNKNLPMNIKTIHSSLLENQQQGKLFDSSDDGAEPILYFGYNKNRFGEIINPKLVYIDEGKLKWQITEKDIEEDNKITTINNEHTENRKTVVLRKDIRKIASGE